MNSIMLTRLNANQAYAFTWGDELIRFHNEDLFFQTRQDAKDAAKRRGLYITNRNTVKPIKE